MGNKITTTSKKLLFIPVYILLVEHFGRIYGIQKRPSYFLELLSTYAMDTFNFIGIQIARLSSFMLYLKMDELMITIWNILRPTLYIIISPLNTLNGYVSQALTYEYKSWQIYFGSMIIMTMLSYLLLKHTTFGRTIVAKFKKSPPKNDIEDLKME